MKLHQIILILFLLSVVQAGDCPETNYTPSKKKDCNEHSKSGKYCCYLDTIAGKFCEEYSQEDYDEIGKMTKDQKKALKDAKTKIECESSYIAFTLLSLILIIL
jgi:hypothetical protein